MGQIAVIGLGPSWNLFKSANLSIGVNDIWRYIHTDIVVCCDPSKNFKPDRLKVIDECTPEAFYSHIVNWDVRPDYQNIQILPGYPDHVVNLDSLLYAKSYCSPFVACQIAYKIYGADEIHLYGVDMVAHPHMDKELCEKITLHFVNLKTALELKGCGLVVHGDGILKDI